MPGTKTAETPDPRNLVQFTESDHRYVALERKSGNEIRDLISVTTLIGEYFPKFDADAMAPRVAAKRGMTPEEVKAEWKLAGEEASRYGTRVHEFMEDTILGRKPRNTPESEKEEKVFASGLSFIRKVKPRLDGFEPEKIVCDVNLGIAGTIDLLCRDPKGSIVMMDWKTNKQIRMDTQYGKYGFPPVSHMPDCEFAHYSLQLNLYEFVLKHAGYIPPAETVVKYLVHLHPDTGATPIKIPDLQGDVVKVVEDFLKRKAAANG